jgi:hypothetical protein
MSGDSDEVIVYILKINNSKYTLSEYLYTKYAVSGDSDEEPMRSSDYGYFHDSAAGDFLLMSRHIAHQIHGYSSVSRSLLPVY